MSLLSTDTIEQLAVQPVPGEFPSGANVRLESAFEAIEQEIAKLDALTVEDPVRWTLVREQCQTILREQSKDLLVACYLTRALCEVDLLQGLEQGMTLARGLVEHHWDGAYPPRKRMRGRAQAFEWLAERCHPLLAQYQVKPSELEILSCMEQSVQALDELLLDKMGDVAPNLAELRLTSRRMKQGLEAEQAKQAEQKPAHALNPSAQNPSIQNQAAAQNSVECAPSRSGTKQRPEKTNDSGLVSSERDLGNTYRAVQEQLRSAGLFLLEKNPLDAEPFRIHRFITWLGVNQVPPATNGRTQLRPPAKDKLDRIQALVAKQDRQALIMELEPGLTRTPFWLAGQRLVAEALDALQATEAVNVVETSVLAWLQQVPGVETLTFYDDTPFADNATRQWLQQTKQKLANQHQSGASGAVGALEVDISGLSQNWEDSYQQAQALLKGKRTREALALFQNGVAQSTSLREQSLWRLNQSRVCVDAGLLDLATPLLEQLDQQLVESGAEQWEPQVSKRVIELLLRCYQSRNDPESYQQKMETLQHRLCRHDLALAFDLITHSR